MSKERTSKSKAVSKSARKADELTDQDLDKVAGGTAETDTNVVSPRDAASGLPTGKRMHKPFTDADGLLGIELAAHEEDRVRRNVADQVEERPINRHGLPGQFHRRHYQRRRQPPLPPPLRSRSRRP